LFHKRKDRAFILVTHDANVIRLYCNNACVLHEGRLLPFSGVDAAYDFYQSTMVSAPPVES
jgi:capsular polysaccharide transport system ATP-binding protein